MNKKTVIGIIIAIVIIIAAIVGYSMLGDNNETSNTTQNVARTTSANSNTTEENTGANQNVLIAYFSETGNTEKFANIIHDQIGGDLFKIEPVTPYPEGDELFDYTKEEQDEDRRPEIQGTVDISKYDTVFIGYPIWWYEVPQIIKTFLDQYDLSGKTIIPFNTHEGSGDGGTYDYIAEQEPNATMLEGLPIRGGNMEENQTDRISNWLGELGF